MLVNIPQTETHGLSCNFFQIAMLVCVRGRGSAFLLGFFLFSVPAAPSCGGRGPLGSRPPDCSYLGSAPHPPGATRAPNGGRGCALQSQPSASNAAGPGLDTTPHLRPRVSSLLQGRAPCIPGPLVTGSFLGDCSGPTGKTQSAPGGCSEVVSPRHIGCHRVSFTFPAGAQGHQRAVLRPSCSVESPRLQTWPTYKDVCVKG